MPRQLDLVTLGPELEPGVLEAGVNALDRGWEQTKGLLLEGLPALAYHLTGNDEDAQRKLLELRDRFDSLPPAVIESFTDIEGPNDALIYLAEALGENIPSLATSLLSGGVGGFIGKKIATGVAKGAVSKLAAGAIGKNVGMAGGAATGSALLNVPESFVNIAGETGEMRGDLALTTGLLKASLDAIPAFRALSTMSTPMKEAVGRVVLKEAGIQFLAEGSTEVGQEILDDAAVQFVDENREIFTPENILKYADTFLKSGLTGGVLGAGSKMAQPKAPEEKPPATPDTTLDDARSVIQEFGLDPNQFTDPVRVAQRIQQNVQNNVERQNILDNLEGETRRRGDPIIAAPEGILAPRIEDEETSLLGRKKPNFTLVDEPKIDDGTGYELDPTKRENILRRFEAAGRRNLKDVDEATQAQDLQRSGTTLGLPELERPKIAGLLSKFASRGGDPNSTYDTPFGRLTGQQIDRTLEENRHIPEVAEVLQSVDLRPDVRRMRGMEALVRNPQPSPKLPKRDGERPRIQSAATPIEATAEGTGLTGEEARLYAGINEQTPPGFSDENTLSTYFEDDGQSILSKFNQGPREATFAPTKKIDYSEPVKQKLKVNQPIDKRTLPVKGKEAAFSSKQEPTVLDDMLQGDLKASKDEGFSTEQLLRDAGLTESEIRSELSNPGYMSKEVREGYRFFGGKWRKADQAQLDYAKQQVLKERKIYEDRMDYLAKNKGNPNIYLRDGYVRLPIGDSRPVRESEVRDTLIRSLEDARKYVEQVERSIELGKPKASRGTSEGDVVFTDAEKDKLHEIIRRATAGKVNLEVLTRPALEQRWHQLGGNPAETPTIRAFYSGAAKTIYVADSGQWINASKDIMHEATHWMWTLLPATDRRILLDNLPALRAYNMQMYGRDPTAGYKEGDRTEEHIAYASGMYNGIRAQGKPVTNLNTLIEKVLEKIYNLWRQFYKEVRYRPSKEVTDILDKIREGDYADATPTLDEATQTIRDAMGPKAAKEYVSGYKSARDLNWFDKIFKHLTAIGEKYPQAQPYVNVVQNMRALTSYIRATYLPKIAKASTPLTKAQHIELAKFMEAAEYTPTLVQKIGDAYTVVVPQNARTELSRPGDRVTVSGPVANAVEQYIEVNTGMRNDMINALLVRLGFKKGMTAAQLRAEGSTEAINLADKISELQKNPNYFPHIRPGDIYIIVKKKDPTKPKEQWKEEYMRTFDLLGKNTSIIRRMHLRLGGDASMAREVKRLKERFPESQYEVSEPRDMTYDAFKKIIGNPVADLALAADMFSTGDKKMIDAFLQELRTELATKGMKAHFAHRNNIPGWLRHDNAATYAEEAMAHYILKGSAFISANEYGQPLEEAMNSITTKNLKDYIKEHMNYITSGEEENQALRNLVFFWFIGFNPSSALVNLTQMMHTTMPLLASFDAASFAKHFPKAFNDARKEVLTRENLLLAVSVNPEMINLGTKPTGWTDAKWEAVKDALRSGNFIPLQAYEFSGSGRGDYASTHGAKRVLAKVAQSAATMFSTVETLNRLTTFLTAYDMFTADPSLMDQFDRWNLKPEEKTPAKAAEYLVNRTQFIMDKANRPTFMRHGMAVPTQFMSFPVQMLEFAGSAFSGRMGPQGKKMLAYQAMALIATSGVWSLWGADNSKDVIEQIYKWASNQDIDLDKEMRDVVEEIGGTGLAHMMSTGFIPYYLNVSLSGRVGAGQIVNPQALSGSMESTLGPAAGMILGSIMESKKQWDDGNTGLAIILAMLPNAFDNLIKGPYAAVSGFKSGRGTMYLPPSEVTTGHVFRQGFGFRPEDVAERQAMDVATDRMGNSLDKISSLFNNRLAVASFDGINARQKQDVQKMIEAEQKVNKILQEMAEFNRGKAPEDMVQVSNTAIKNKVEQMILGQPSMRGIPKRMQGEAQRMQRLYGYG